MLRLVPGWVIAVFDFVEDTAIILIIKVFVQLFVSDEDYLSLGRRRKWIIANKSKENRTSRESIL